MSYICNMEINGRDKQFVGFREIPSHTDIVVVDAYYPGAQALSHWREAMSREALLDDTSAGIVLEALKQDHPATHLPYVTNNHFDVDGFLAVWSLFEPGLALAYESVLKRAATIADFREYEPGTQTEEHALKIVCWINQMEKTRFYGPFGVKDEVVQSVEKYHWFLPRFAAVLTDIEAHREIWEPEYELVHKHIAQLQASDSQVRLLKDLRLLIVQTPEPIHYYALYSQSREADMVLSVYDGNRYELEYCYTTWVDTAHRFSYPRIPMEELTDQLNELETADYTWTCGRLMDTAPLLRLEGADFSKAERYDHPFRRPIYSSHIPPEHLIQLVQDYYHRHYRHIEPRRYWTWGEMRKVGRV